VHTAHRFFPALLLATALASSIVIAGCSEHNTYHVYDPYHNDYHRWDDHESGLYVQWEHETHRDHRDLDKRDANEQKEYWNWRHENQ
jgi:protein-tyrosine phosphatase